MRIARKDKLTDDVGKETEEKESKMRDIAPSCSDKLKESMCVRSVLLQF